MPKTKISEFDVDPANNTDINSINIAEGCAPSGINNAIRQLMSDLKEFQTGAGGDPFNGAVNGTVGATTPASGAFTTLSASSTATLNTLSSSGATITGGSINGTTVGASTASTGAFTSLSASGAFSANGGATLGDASGDALTINSSAVSIPNGLNFDSNTLVIDATNNRIGVGTTSPSYDVDITKSAVSAGVSARVRNSDATSATSYAQLRLETGLNDASINAYSGTSGAGYLNFFNEGSERMRITSTGNVGIGTTSPAFGIDLVANSGNIRTSDNATNATNKFGRLILRHYTNAEEDTYLVGGLNTSTTNEVFIGGGSGALNQATVIKFFTGTNNTTLGSTERIRIDSDGNLLVGTTTAGASKLVVNSDSIQVNTAKTPASATATGTTGQIAWDSNYVYVCVATNTWKRTALSTW